MRGWGVPERCMSAVTSARVKGWPPHAMSLSRYLLRRGVWVSVAGLRVRVGGGIEQGNLVVAAAPALQPSAA